MRSQLEAMQEALSETLNLSREVSESLRSTLMRIGYWFNPRNWFPLLTFGCLAYLLWNLLPRLKRLPNYYTRHGFGRSSDKDISQLSPTQHLLAPSDRLWNERKGIMFDQACIRHLLQQDLESIHGDDN